MHDDGTPNHPDEGANGLGADDSHAFQFNDRLDQPPPAPASPGDERGHPVVEGEVVEGGVVEGVSIVEPVPQVAVPGSGKGVVVKPERKPIALRGKVSGFHERHPMPRPGYLAREIAWLTAHGGGAAVKVVLASPYWIPAEVVPIGRGLARLGQAWRHWRTCVDYAETVKAAEGNEKVKHGRDLENRRQGRRRFSFLVAVLALAGVLALAWWSVQPDATFAQRWSLTALAVIVLAALDGIGRKGVEGAPLPKAPQGPVRAGIPLSSLRSQVHLSLEDQGFLPEDVVIEMPRPERDGWEMPYWCRHVIDDEHLRAIERHLQIRQGACTVLRERANASRGVLRMMIVDPLANVLDSPDPDGPLTIFNPLALGMVAGGVEWIENFLRTHFSVTGKSQSGKSSCFWQVIDVLRRCLEVEMDGIDLTGGPAFSAPRRAFRKVAYDRDAALALLREARALAEGRIAELRRLAADDETPDDFEEKWRPTPQHPQRVVLIDEYAQFKDDDELLDEVEWLARNGAKAAVTLGIATQGGTLQDWHRSPIRAQMMLIILFACSRQDVLDLMGKDARDQGFRPDLFESAAGGAINDAGKCYAMSPTSRTAVQRRAYRLEQAEVRRRDRRLGERKVEPGVVDAIVIPPLLVEVGKAFAEQGDPEILATADLLDWLRRKDTPAEGRRLATEMRRIGMAPDQHKTSKVRGYWWADYERARAKAERGEPLALREDEAA